MKLKLILALIYSVALLAIVSSCQSNSSYLESNLGKTVTISGIFVRGPSGYIIFRGEDLESVYLIPKTGRRRQVQVIRSAE
jgi:hypothetical protein